MCDGEPIAVNLEVGALAGRRDDYQYMSLGTRRNNAYILCREEQYLQRCSDDGALCDGGIEGGHQEDIWAGKGPARSLGKVVGCRISYQDRTDVGLQRTKNNLKKLRPPCNN